MDSHFRGASQTHTYRDHIYFLSSTSMIENVCSVCSLALIQIAGEDFKGQVTMARSKVKSRSHHDVALLQPQTNVPIKYQLPTSYTFRDIAWTRFYRSRSHHCVAHLHPLSNVPTKQQQLPTSYGFEDIAQIRFSNSRSLRLSLRSKVKSRSHYDVAHQHTQCPYQLPTPFGF